MPTPQTYANHTHYPKLWAAGMLFWLAAVVLACLHWFGYGVLPLAQAAGLAALFVALGIGRVYVTALQDRIIRLEMAVRCASLLTPAQRQQLAKLPIKHVVALRFASDAELPALLERAVGENLTPDQIKREVKDWQADYART